MILHDKTMNNIKEHVQRLVNMQEKLHLGHSHTKTIAHDRTMSSLDENVQKIVKCKKNMHYEWCWCLTMSGWLDTIALNRPMEKAIICEYFSLYCLSMYSLRCRIYNTTSPLNQCKRYVSRQNWLNISLIILRTSTQWENCQIKRHKCNFSLTFLVTI